MSGFIKTSLFSLAVFFLFQITNAQSNIDSIIEKRAEKLDEYTFLMNDMKERTWIKLVRVNEKASEIINVDNILLNEVLTSALNDSKILNSQLSHLQTEISYLQREAEIQNLLISERTHLTKTLLIILASASLLLIIALILVIERHIKYRKSLLEIEHLIESGNISLTSPAKSEQMVAAENKIVDLNKEKNKLESKLKDQQTLIKDKEVMLEKEISSRKVIEEEIKDLIALIKKK